MRSGGGISPCARAADRTLGDEPYTPAWTTGSTSLESQGTFANTGPGGRLVASARCARGGARIGGSPGTFASGSQTATLGTRPSRRTRLTRSGQPESSAPSRAGPRRSKEHWSPRPRSSSCPSSSSTSSPPQTGWCCPRRRRSGKPGRGRGFLSETLRAEPTGPTKQAARLSISLDVCPHESAPTRPQSSTSVIQSCPGCTSRSASASHRRR